MYHAADASMIRASVFPLTATLPSCPSPVDDAADDADNCRQWIAKVWADDARAGAIELAAPVLASGIRKVIDGTARRSRIRRTALSLTRYLLRMQYRATPFGLFAGPAPARVGRAAHVRWGTQRKAFARADATWLHDIITALEQDPDVLRHLPVVADPTCTVRGARIAVPHQPGAKGPTETTLRRTRAAEMVLALAQSPTTVSAIVAKLHAEYPDTPTQTIEAMVCDLIAHRVLLTSLYAPMTCDDALGHLVAQLDTLALAATPVAPTVGKLRHVYRLLSRHDRAHPVEQRVLRAQATAAMGGLTGTADRSLAVNLRPDCDIVLPEAVTQEAQRALEVIARISPYPNGTPAWRDYRVRFLERYSMGTVVPVRDLTDPDTGLGFPAGYRGTILKRPILATTPRDEHLLALAQDSAVSDQREIVLTEDDIEALSNGTPTQVPAHIQFSFSVLAQSTRALDEGRFLLSTVGLSLAAGITTGRFLTMLERADLDRVAAIHASLPTLTSGAVRGQVSGPPLKVPINNVSRTPLVASELLAVGEHNPDVTRDLDDLGVIADATRLYLVSLSTGRLIEPSVMNAVELSNSTHPLIRFLCEVHRSHTTVLVPFAWGAAARLPFLPEVRVGRTILSAARWRLRAGDLGEGDDWMRRFTNWRIRYGLPRTVYLGGSDQRLRLDVDVPAHQQLLRAELRRHNTAVLHEAPEESAFGWIDRAHEVTMSFTSDQQPAPAPASRTATAADRNSGRFPGTSEWAYVKLYGSAARAPEVLTAHLPRLLGDWGAVPPAAWFIRYADPEPHVRLRLRLPCPEAFGTAVQTVTAWAAELRDEGLIQRVQWDTDQPETGRYGTGAALEAAEAYFVADSTAALAQMSLALPTDLQPAITSASYVDVATGFLGSRSAGHEWLIRHLLRSDGEMVPRNIQSLALRLSEGNGRAVLADLDGGDAVAKAWQLRRTALDHYRQSLDADGISPARVLPSLLHMHHNRVAGIDRDAESACRRIARAAALSCTIRPEGAQR
ncbi:lantibiotic dehydratase [Streptomyces halobius]|uniref:Lantibiotic dehydratase n=1 Tax=Streptomyces halobius TaxID=2879846 RepID=A0ABY4MDA3_9ACTN|nr:lantibiotic dehydratase [Streptomyces halobius]UQA95712.1 lantibiotic dehydratase [Streptomyces halobius]